MLPPGLPTSCRIGSARSLLPSSLDVSPADSKAVLTVDTHSEARQRWLKPQPVICRVKQSMTTTRKTGMRSDSWKLVMSICQARFGSAGSILFTLLGLHVRCQIFGRDSPWSRMILSTLLRLTMSPYRLRSRTLILR